MPALIKTILFLPAWYPNRNHLSIGSFIRSHAEAVNTKVNVNVLHVCGDEKMSAIYEFEKSVVNGVDTYILYYKKSQHKTVLFQLVKAILYFFGQFYGYHLYRKQENQPTAFHVHVLTRAAILPFALGLFCKIDYFITEHWSRYLPQDNSYTGFFRKIFTKLIVKRSKGVSAVSENLKFHMNSHGLKHLNFKVISNVVNPVFLQAFCDVNPKKYFVHVSNFATCKNVTGLLKAFQIVQDKGYQFHLKMVGDGVELKNAKRQVAEQGLSNVSFTGFLYGQDLVTLMQGAQALILFSEYENQPVVILESLSLGVPVVATTVGGIPEMIDSSNGLLVAHNDVKGLSDALIKVLMEEVTFDAEEIREQAHLKFTSDVIANQFLAFYRDGGISLK